MMHGQVDVLKRELEALKHVILFFIADLIALHRHARLRRFKPRHDRLGQMYLSMGWHHKCQSYSNNN